MHRATSPALRADSVTYPVALYMRRSMPTAALRVCSTCQGRHGAGEHCPQKAGGRWQGVSPSRIRGRRLQRERATLFSNEPFCRACKAAGRTMLAVIRDHIIPLTEGGLDVTENTQPLCQECSDIKTRAESMRGRLR